MAAVTSPNTDRLLLGAWAEENRRRLEALLHDVSGRSGRQVAVFDWDHTMMFGCLGEAVFRVQLEELELRWSQEQLEALLSVVDALGPDVDGAALAADLRQAWFDVAARRSEAEVVDSPAHRDLCARMGFLYSALESAPELGPPVAYRWLVDTLAGCADDVIEDIGRKALARGLDEPIGRGRYQTATDGHFGPVGFGYATGVRRQPEMEQLAAALEEAGVEVWVVTASHEATIRAAVVELGLAIRPERVRGALVSSHLADGCEPQRPTPYRRGKVDIIEHEIGVVPVLVAGDSISDVDMLTKWSETEVRLVIDRARPELRALKSPGDVLLQGRDEPAGCFWPRRTSRSLSGQAVRD